MFEKRWAAISSRLFTADGTSTGTVTLASTKNFRVKQQIIIVATSMISIECEVKRVDSSTVMEVGPVGAITKRSDLTGYTVLTGAAVLANEQPRSTIPEKEYARAAFEEEPVVAWRTFLVDDFGDPYNSTNPFPVSFDGTVSIGDVSIVDNGNTMLVNSDGSIDVNVLNTSPSTPGLNIFYNEATAVMSGVETTIFTYTAGTANGTRVFKIDTSGENIATFKVKVNGTVISLKRTYWGLFNASFAFENFENGLKLNTGDILTVTAKHPSPVPGNFEATVMGLIL